jgi:AcrR family transcriptional regulator
MATTSRGARTRQAIVGAAADVFAERGFLAASVNDVLGQVRLTKGAFYFHFSTKEELAHAVCESYHEWLRNLQRSASADEPDPVRRIPRVLLEAALAYRRDPVARATTRLLEESNQLDLPHLSPVWVPWWTTTLGEAQARGALDPGLDIPRFAWVLTAGWYGSQSNSYAESAWVGLPARLADLLRFTLLPAITCPDTATALRSDLDRLPAAARQADDGP